MSGVWSLEADGCVFRRWALAFDCGYPDGQHTLSPLLKEVWVWGMRSELLAVPRTLQI